jgi:hypothetical protein
LTEIQNKVYFISLAMTKKIPYFNFVLSTSAIAMQCPDNSRKAISYALMDLNTNSSFKGSAKELIHSINVFLQLLLSTLLFLKLLLQ